MANEGLEAENLKRRVRCQCRQEPHYSTVEFKPQRDKHRSNTKVNGLELGNTSEILEEESESNISILGKYCQTEDEFCFCINQNDKEDSDAIKMNEDKLSHASSVENVRGKIKTKRVQAILNGIRKMIRRRFRRKKRNWTGFVLYSRHQPKHVPHVYRPVPFSPRQLAPSRADGF